MTKVVQILLSVLGLLIPTLKKADSKESVKESSEMLIGLNEVSLLLVKKFKDGVQFSDFTEMYASLQSDEELKEKLKDAYDKYDAIPSELKDTDAGEALELTSIQISYVPLIIDGLKKEA